MTEEQCVWTRSEVRWHSDVWLPACDPDGGGADFADRAGPQPNGFKFCPFCGKPLREEQE